uniref:Xylanolytic transcriptional activator regulatory domain-containing protein n=1 Tax=Fusarium oxysporum (strain Fo5176) TaxID=660025 RepID=A0A0D2XKV7_FUSOF
MARNVRTTVSDPTMALMPAARPRHATPRNARLRGSVAPWLRGPLKFRNIDTLIPPPLHALARQFFIDIPRNSLEAEKDNGDRRNPSATPKETGPGFSSVRSMPHAQVYPRADVPPKRDRIAQLEERVKYLCDRLSTTETQPNSTNATRDSTTGPASSAASILTSQHESFRVDDPGVYQGGSSFSDQSVQANDISQSSIAASNIVSRYDLDTISRQLKDHLQPLDMPALSKDYQLSSSVTSKHHPEMELLPTQLSPLAQEHDLKAHISTCERNFSRGIETYQALAMPCFENVFSLALGMTKAQEEGKPFLCCTLLAAAASHCRMLGYCQEATYGKHQARRADQMRRAFWSIYITDKNMSLLQGRPSYLQDTEVDAWYPRVSPDAPCKAWDELFILGIKFAKIQGEVYGHLYSSTARHSSPAQQEQAVNQLSDKMQSWYIDLGKMKDHKVFELSKKSWDVMYYSTLTLILIKATTTDEESGISLKCVEAARAGLQSHLICFSSYQTIDSPGLVSESDYASCHH